MGKGASDRPGWGWIAGLTAFIYASLPVMPYIWRTLDRRAPWLLMGGMVAMALLSVGALWIVTLVDRGERRPLPLIVLATATGFFALGFYIPAFPSERVHFLEYGLLGMLILRASLRTMPQSWRASFGLAAVVLCTIGTLDEIIQFLLPNRFFDWRDLWFNLIGGLLGFGAYLVVAPPEGRP